MTNKEIYYLVGVCLTFNEQPIEKQEFIRCKLQNREVSWERFVKIASDHLVLPVIYLNFKKNNLLEYLPIALTEHLALIHKLNCERNAAILDQIEEINQLMSQADILPIYLKGSANLLDGLYSDIGERMMGDIDFLVADDDYFKAAAILKKAGYFTNAREYVEKLQFNKHYPRLAHNEKQADVEVHRLLVENDYSKHFNYYTIISDIKKSNSLPKYATLSDKHKAELNFFHAYFIFEFNGNISFRNAYDLFLISKRTDLSVLVKQLQHQTKNCITYFLFAFHMLGIDDQLSIKHGFRYKKFLLKHSWRFKHSYLVKPFLLIGYLKYVFLVYTDKLGKILIYKEYRKGLFMRLKKENWIRTFIG